MRTFAAGLVAAVGLLLGVTLGVVAASPVMADAGIVTARPAIAVYDVSSLADPALAFTESGGNLALDVFRLSGSDVPVLVRTPVFAPTGNEAPRQLPTATPVVPAGPPLSIAGEWSITRTYWRSCPRCGTTIIRTTPWEITQAGADIRVDRGLRGVVTGSGPALLTLEGTESEGFGVQRFWYATLRVAADGRSFEGSFNGSETIQNPCGSDPPSVTCFVSAGWLRAVLVSPATAPTDTPTSTPTPTETPTPRPIGPLPVSSPTAVATSVMDASGSTRALLPVVMSR